MSELLLHWLNNSLQLSKVVTDVDADFASGYLLGELLFKLNQQHNFTDFMDSAIADAKIINFCLLEPTLRHLNVKFDARIATAIMNRERGAAANVLYQLKMTADRLARAPGVSTRPKNDVMPLHNMPTKLPKPAYDAAHHYFFQHSIRRQVKSLDALQRQRDAMETEKHEKHEYRERQARIQEQLEITKAERLHQAFIHTQYIQTTLEETDSPAWRQALATKREREQRRSRFYQQLLAQQAQRQLDHTFSLRQTVERDLDAFDPVPTSTATKQLSKPSTGYGLRSLSTTLETSRQAEDELRDPSKPVPVGEPRSSTSIRELKLSRARRREQMERRRRRFVQDVVHHQGQLNSTRVMRGLEELVQRPTPTEDGSSITMAKILVYKQIATENRMRREERYATRRTMDANDAMDRDTASMELLFAKFTNDSSALAMHKEQRVTAVEVARQHENQLVVGMALHELVQLALVAAGKREESMHMREHAAFLSTDTTWDEWRYLFAQHGPYGLYDDAVDDEKLDALAHHQLVEYLQYFIVVAWNHRGDYVGAVAKGTGLSPWVPSDWKFVGAVEVLEASVVLGELVKYTRWVAHSDCPSIEQPRVQLIEAEAVEDVVASEPIETVAASSQAVIDALAERPSTVPQDETFHQTLPPLRILMCGPPFAGKTTQAKLLAAKYELALLSVEVALTSAMNEQSPIGVEARALLLDGHEITPLLYSQLAVGAIQKLSLEQRERWVLYDLPPTAAHARALEEQLTGFVHPTKIASPLEYASIVAPGTQPMPLPKNYLHGKSGVDLVVYLECAESTVVERCLGQLEDSATHDTSSHLLFSPPPFDATHRHRLRHANATTNASELLSLQWLSTSDCVRAHASWVAQFDTLKPVATTESQDVGQSIAVLTRTLTSEATHERIVGIIEDLELQRQAMAQDKERDRELKEAQRMQQEEHRQLTLTELKKCITEAQQGVTVAQQTVQQAEEAKAKKEEVAELKNGVEAAKKHVEAALIAARDWVVDEQLRTRNSRSVYSGSLHPPLAGVLASMWDAVEAQYILAMRRSFRLQRQQRARVEQRAQWMVETMSRLVRRVDGRPKLLTEFQGQFNAVLHAMRFDTATKQELHARTDVLQDALIQVITMKQRESKDELREMLADSWTDDMSQLIAVAFALALQAECDRFRGSLQLLVDGFLAASDEPAAMAGVAEQLQLSLSLLNELSLQALSEAPAVAAPPATAAAAAAPAAAAPPANAKGAKTPAKGKPPLMPTPSIHAVVEPATPADPLAVDALLLCYDTVLQKSDALLQLIVSAPRKQAEVAKPPEPVAPPPITTKTKTGNTPAATPTATPVSSMALLPRVRLDVATSNFHKAVKYEHDLLVRRVRFLKDSVQTACDHVTRAMRSVEKTLKEMIDERALREEAAAAAVLHHIRSTIEAETDLPYYINGQPDQVYRFPSTAHLIEDTRAIVDTSIRLVPRPPVDPPPVIQEFHECRLNETQASGIRERLIESAFDGVGQICDVVATLSALATVPHALPIKWQWLSEEQVAQVVAKFADAECGLVEIDLLVDAMANDDGLLPEETPTPTVSDAMQPADEVVGLV